MEAKVESNSKIKAESKVGSLYKKLIDCWNNRNPNDYTGLFTVDGNVVGFDE